MPKYKININYTLGRYIALAIISLWFLAFLFGMRIDFDLSSPLQWIWIGVVTHLFTGLFITAHDAMHGTVYKSNTAWNRRLGQLCTVLYAFFSFDKMYEKHHMHHDHTATEEDPDVHEGSFFVWYYKFLREYISIWQIVFYAIAFNLLKLIFPTENLIFFWIMPALLSTFQLFYFGTYRPHHKTHQNRNVFHSGSMKLNHFLSFFACYFFGYHYEHHALPYVPWWQLWKVKEVYDKNPEYLNESSISEAIL